MRPLMAAVLLAAITALALGCGGSKSGHADTSPREHRPPISAPFVTFAKAVNLRAADLPGWREAAASNPRLPTDARHAALARCTRTKPFRYLARLSSATFARGGDSAGATAVSIVSVAPTPLLATSEFAALATARGRSCYARLAKAKKAEDFRFSSEYFSWSSLPLPAAAHGVKVRLAGTLAGSGEGPRRTHLYLDLLAFARGRAQIVLFASAWPSPLQPSVERRLLALLYSRATAHTL